MGRDYKIWDLGGEKGGGLHFLVHAESVWVVWTFRGRLLAASKNGPVIRLC
jgi:hypothetical protein